MGYKKTIQLLIEIKESANFKELDKEIQEKVNREIDIAKNRGYQ